ncbi:Uncharacterised protein [Bordetella pertussis]|nr:Uncharacterised protein [Bordetella pertussis]CFP57656.1 Uncharacterised protein [Bordetella pertussis]CFW30506.1 Uncharacterised protein [Bordetella pertussis]
MPMSRGVLPGTSVAITDPVVRITMGASSRYERSQGAGLRLLRGQRSGLSLCGLGGVALNLVFVLDDLTVYFVDQ